MNNEIIELYLQMNPEQKKQFIEMLNRLVAEETKHTDKGPASCPRATD